VTDLRDAFERFDADNPKVWELFVRFTKQLIARGFKHYSADAVLHRVRWETAVETTGDAFKVNNNFVSGYARKFEREYPEHAGFFRMRQSAFDGAGQRVLFRPEGWV